MPLKQEISAKIQATNEIVGDTTESDKAAAHVKTLNYELFKAKLTGESVQVFSQSLIWTTERIEDGKTVVESTLDPELLKKRSVRGTFIGVTEMLVDQQHILMYQLSVDLDDESMAYHSVLTPVDESTLLIATEGSVNAELNENVAENYQLLLGVENLKFQEVLKDFMDVIKNGEPVDATKLREIGLITIWLMAQDGIKDDVKMRDAIVGIIKASIDTTALYSIVGAEVIVNTGERAGTATIQQHESKSHIQGFAAINDYDTDSTGKIEFAATMQPVIFIDDENGQRRYIPLRYMRTFYKESYDSCSTSRERFISKFPNILRLIHE